MRSCICSGRMKDHDSRYYIRTILSGAGADGAVWFGHWGCKHTLGAAQLAKRKFEEQGIPLLILDGDGCDRSHGGEGQTSTRLGAFLEMLNTETDENTDRQEESHDE